jgi:general secretion pathway protein H
MISRSDIRGKDQCRHGVAGFTLVEMIVVLAVLALALTLILGNGKTVSPAIHARAAAESISAALRSARSEAVRENRGILFTIDLASSRYQWGHTSPQVLPNDISLSLMTSRDQLVSDSAGRIRFNPDGSSSGGRVSVSGADRIWWVGVDWLSGRVSIAEKPR